MSGRQSDVDAGRRPGTGTSPSSPRSIARIVVAVLACLVHAVFGVTVAVSGLIMPMGAVYLLGLFWIAGVAAMIRARHRPALMIVVPIVSWVVWFTVVWIGDAWWGWTA